MRISPIINSYGFLKTNFKGYPVVLVDGGKHAVEMSRFANALNKNIDIETINVEVNASDERCKQLKNLEEELKKLNENDSVKGKYVAIPAFACAPVCDVEKVYNKVFEKNIKILPHDLSVHRNRLLDLLNVFYQNPEKYQDEIKLLDSKSQGLEYAYGVIEQINKLTEKGAKVYIPAGHPKDRFLWQLAKQKERENELRYCIATGLDVDEKVVELYREVEEKRLYDFNFLSLSKAKTMSVDAYNMAQKYLYESYDALTSDIVKGIYNISPVRKDGVVTGYSYTDTQTNQIPLSEFEGDEKVQRLNQFVGKKLDETILANEEETKEIRRRRVEKEDTTVCPDKLYPLIGVFDKNVFEKRKMFVKGHYVDNKLQEYFNVNDRGEVVYPNCNYEANRKPAVSYRAGSDYAVLTAISNDINKIEEDKAQKERENSGKDVEAIKKHIEEAMSEKDYKTAEFWALKIIDNNENVDVDVLENYLETLIKLKKKDEATKIADEILSIYLEKVKNSQFKSLDEINEAIERPDNYKEITYDELLRGESQIKSFSDMYKKLMKKEKDIKEAKKAQNTLDNLMKIAKLYEKKSFLYKKIDYKTSKLYLLVFYDISKQTDKGKIIIERFTQGQYDVDDLYDIK